MKIRQHYKELIVVPLCDASLSAVSLAAKRIEDSLQAFGYSFERVTDSAGHLQDPRCTYALEHARPDGVPFKLVAFDHAAGARLFVLPERVSLWASRTYGFSHLAVVHFALITANGDVVFIAMSQLTPSVHAFVIPDSAVDSLYLEFVFNHANLLKDNGQGACTDDGCESDAWVPLKPTFVEGEAS